MPASSQEQRAESTDQTVPDRIIPASLMDASVRGNSMYLSAGLSCGIQTLRYSCFLTQ